MKKQETTPVLNVDPRQYEGVEKWKHNYDNAEHRECMLMDMEAQLKRIRADPIFSVMGRVKVNCFIEASLILLKEAVSIIDGEKKPTSSTIIVEEK